MKPGLSLHIVTLLPKSISAKVQNLSKTSALTSGELTTSSNGRYLGGLKKCVIKNLDDKSVVISVINSERGIVDVLEDNIVSLPIFCASFLYNFFLISRFSIITSITQSQSINLCKSSSIFPGVISLEFFLCMSISGLDLCIYFIAFLAIILRSDDSSSTISSKRTSQPAFAQWAAMPEPITPLPMTATFLIVLGIIPTPIFFLKL